MARGKEGWWSSRAASGAQARILSTVVSLFILLRLLGCAIGPEHKTSKPRSMPGLPAGIKDYASQLKVLDLPGTTDDLDWLPDTLQELHVEYGAPVIHHFPRRLAVLDLRQSRLKEFPDLPPNLILLDARGASLKLPPLPDGLVSFLGSRSPSRWPSSLRFLTLAGAKELGELPASLDSLVLDGTEVNLLEDLPRHLRVLVVNGTRLQRLANLPETIERLQVTRNPSLAAWDVPKYVVDLIVDQEPMPNVQELRYLDRLDAYQTANQLRSPDWPKFLRILSLTSIRGLTQLAPFPDSLRELSLQGEDIDLSRLPRSLERLKVTASTLRNLNGLPPHLKELSLRLCQVDDLSGLIGMSNLKRLDLSMPTLTKLPELPTNLEELTANWTGITTLGDLPRDLSNLDVSGSTRLKEMHCLSPSLKHLKIAQTAMAGSLFTEAQEKPAHCFPSHLEQLDISETEIRSLRLPGSTTDLDISWSRIEALSQVKDLIGQPVMLRSLTVGKGQLRTLSGLPQSVSTLRILDRNFIL